MSQLHYFKTIPARFIAALLLLLTPAHGETIGRLSTRFLARGEQALLEVCVTGSQPTEFPTIPTLKGVEIRNAGRGPQTQQLPGRRIEYVFEYLISSYDVGNHVIPSIDVMAGGSKSHTEPIEFTVFNPDELQWSETSAGDTKFRYATAFRVMNPNPYVGETTPVEIKLFVPRDLFVEDWGIPDFERDGVTAWRFQNSAMRGEINLLGIPYVSVAYPSTITPTQLGKVGIGPANIRLMTTQVVMDGILRRVTIETHLTVPKLTLESLPLPDGAPDGFENAVGDLHIDVNVDATKVQEGDPIPVEIIVSGTGNLDTLHAPKPVDAAGWKIYDAASDQRGDERRELSGSTVFHQFLRPLEIKSAVPAFRLVYFDPKKKTYNTVTTKPVLLQMTPAKTSPVESLAPPQASAIPVERMTDILGLIPPTKIHPSSSFNLPSWIGHAIGGLLAFILIAKILWMRTYHLFHKDPRKVAQLKALREIEKIQGDDTAFLMSSGKFIESWLGENRSPEVISILTERDLLCFQPEKTHTSLLDTKRRNDILRALRKAILACFMLSLVCLTNEARAQQPTDLARDAYDSAKFDEAIAHWLKAGRYEDLSPDVLYNIGDACYRAGSPGYAALYFRRALARDPSHQEARQNLRFIERKYGSINIQRPEYQYAISRISLTNWQNMVWAGLWICSLAILVFPATRPGARMRIVAIVALVIGPLLASCGGLGWRYFPDDAEFALVEHQAVIISEKAALHTDAARSSPEVIDAPPGSLCEIIHQNGHWVFVAFASKTRGWIPVESIEKIIPDKAPTPPKISKPKVDEKSA